VRSAETAVACLAPAVVTELAERHLCIRSRVVANDRRKPSSVEARRNGRIISSLSSSGITAIPGGLVVTVDSQQACCIQSRTMRRRDRVAA